MINHFRFLRGYQKGFRILREFRPDLLHVHSLTRHGFIAMVYRLLTGTPYVVTEHWSRYLPGNSAYKGFFRKLITKCVVRRAAGMAAVSQTLQKAMQNQGLENRRFRVIANPVDTGRFRILDENRKKTEPVKRIIHISCFDEKSKNISGFLRILKKISADRNDFVCHLVGTGPDLEKMKQYAGELSIPEKTVVFTGLIEGDALVKEINDSDFLVLSSNFETFGTVVAESLSCGIPVLATRVGIVPGVVNNDNGMITEPGNEGEMEAAMRLMLQECRNFDRDKVRKSVSGLFSMERIGKDLMDLYSEALNKQNRTTL
jgi:glycosyltransferase involved in cell wall biosynthesis